MVITYTVVNFTDHNTANEKNTLTHRILLLTWNNCYLNMDILQAISFILKCGVKYVAIVELRGCATLCNGYNVNYLLCWDYNLIHVS